MKKLFYLPLIILILSGCRSLGSWYNMNPPPSDEMKIDSPEEIDFMVKRVTYNSTTYDLIVLNPQKIPLEIIHSPDSKGLSFYDLKDDVLFAVNGGIFQKDRKPLGYYSRKGVELHPLNRADGYGNFYMKPNGVFFVTENIPRILETEQFHDYLW
ncbi:MAG: hypothetical protein JEY91_14095, partial [Spirochaetaceae bacterium]|nr:hypothetical protein [Spirochaetaceae bacterium]